MHARSEVNRIARSRRNFHGNLRASGIARRYTSGLAIHTRFGIPKERRSRGLAKRDENARKITVSGRSLGRPRGTRPGCAGTIALSVESAGVRSSHHELRRRKYQLEARGQRSDRRFPTDSPVDQRQRRRHRQHPARWIRDALLSKLQGLANRYRGVEFEDEMVEMYPMCAFGNNSVAASIDTPLHGFLPFEHIDHLHPDWGIALAAAANGREKMEEFNRQYGHKLIWLPWQRPGFELAMMLREAVDENSRVRRCRARWTRTVYLGRHAARVLCEYDYDHRPARTIRARSRREMRR